METDVKLGVLQLPVKECQEFPGATGSWKRQGRVLPLSLQRECGPAHALISGLQLWFVLASVRLSLSCGRFGMRKIAHWCGCPRNGGEVQVLCCCISTLGGLEAGGTEPTNMAERPSWTPLGRVCLACWVWGPWAVS